MIFPKPLSLRLKLTDGRTVTFSCISGWLVKWYLSLKSHVEIEFTVVDEREFMNEIEARSRIQETLFPLISNHDQENQSAIDDATSELLVVWRVRDDVAQTPGRAGALLPFRYVIPDEDLKLVETIYSVLTTAAGVGYFLPHMGFDPTKGVVAALTGIMVAILRVVGNLRLAVRLTPEDYAIVALLAAARSKGLALDELFAGYSPSFPNVSIEQAEHRLEALCACARENGEKVALVWKDGEGRWHANGI